MIIETGKIERGDRVYASMSVSNRTRGWSKTLSLLVGREMPSASHKEMIAAGLMERDGQLCIPFN